MHSVMNQIRNRTDFQIVLLCKLFQIGTARHRTVFLQYLDDHGSRFITGHARQIGTRFGMPSAGQHTTGLCHQRKYVSWLHQVGRFCICSHRGLHCLGTIGRRDTGCHPFRGFNRNCEIGAMPVIGRTDHQWQTQAFTSFLGQR